MSEEKRLVTTLGDRSGGSLGWMLAHEHIFANFVADDDHGVSSDTVVQRMLPVLTSAKVAGVTAIVDATAAGGARRADILLATSWAANLPVVVATGTFKEPAKQQWAATYSDAALSARFVHELDYGIDDSNVRAGWVKLSVTDSGVQTHEARLIRAAAAASSVTGAAVGCHTVGGPLANAVLDIFEAAGGDPSRFIWIHTQTEPDVAAHLAFARRGGWIEYDAFDSQPDDTVYADWIMQVLNAGLGDHLLISHDRNGYNPAQPHGGDIQPYTALFERLLPLLRARGADDATIDLLLRDNPFRAYAR